jgi:hypothetical protein
VKTWTKWTTAVLVIAGAAAIGYAEMGSTGWEVGELRENGLRIVPSGRSDAGAVLEPGQFPDRSVRAAYRIATRIPETLNRLYCWCGCENRGVHRSNLGCFEDLMAVNCDVCRGTAEIAHRMIREKGITDPGRLQLAVDRVWAPEGAELWNPDGGA